LNANALPGSATVTVGELAHDDLGISPYRKLPNVIAEVFSAYRYAGVVDDFLAAPPVTPRVPVALAT
jgi:hypothetical protein